MKRVMILFVSCLLVVGVHAQTQDKLNSSAKVDYAKADADLNAVYKKILQNYKSDTVFIKNTKEAQRQWLKFRDAQVRMKYSSSDNGSILPMCCFYYLKELTQARTKELSLWLEGVEEGDACSGTIRIKE